MRKSNYLILSGLYFDFNDDLTKIINIKESFKKQNILDLSRFDKIKIIKKDQFIECKNINFVYLPISINKIYEASFFENKIQILDLSKCLKLKLIDPSCFEHNQLKQLKLPENIEIIGEFAFYINQIEILDLSNCIKLKNINNFAFEKNQIKQLKLPNNIEEIECSAFANNQIESLDLSNYKKLKDIYKSAFSKNPLKEIKILNDIDINYSYDDDYKYDLWNRFVKYYNNNNKKSGDYKYENDEWKWYPLKKK